jgi:predicted ATP-grasp superfamily ATP-dependent carboligase
MAKIAIVDGYSGGEHLAPQLIKEGHELIHIQSDTPLWEKVMPTFNFSVYKNNFHETDLSFLAEEKVDFYIPGTETGVFLADRLGKTFNKKHNSTDLSLARRDKYRMLKVCQKYGLQVPNFQKVKNVDQAINFFIRNGLSKVVLKPLSSAGTDGVHFCQTTDEVAFAFNQIFSQQNKLGIQNSELLISEFMQGDEYFVNTVSSLDQIDITDVWRYEKRSINNHSAVYDRNILCHPNELRVREVIEYTKEVLKALKIDYGPAHTEVMYTEKGPMLVEIGARVDGLTLPEVNRATIGYSPIDLISKAYTEGIFDHIYKPKKYAQTVYLTSYIQGELIDFTGEGKLKELDSFFQLTMRAKVGGQVYRTIDYFTAPGFVTLISESIDQINEDYTKIRDLESRNELFRIK